MIDIRDCILKKRRKIKKLFGLLELKFVLFELRKQRKYSIHTQVIFWGLIFTIFVFLLSYAGIFSIPIATILGLDDMSPNGFVRFFISRFMYCYADVSVWFIIPLLITLYYFYYRQQRAISESYLTRNDISIVKLAVTVFLAILAIYINNIKGETTVGTTIICIGTGIWAWSFIRFVFNHLKVEYVFRDNIRYIHKLIKILKHTEHLKNEDWSLLCDEVNWRFDIIYQILRYIINHNLKTIYMNFLPQMGKEIQYLNTIILKEKFEDNSKRILKIYANILINYDSFCKILYNNSYDEFPVAIKKFFSFYPKEIGNLVDDYSLSVLNEFYCVIWDICRFLANNERSYFQELVNQLIKLGKTAQERESICIVFKSLLVNAVEENNLSFLTEICYYQMEFIEELKHEQENYSISVNGVDDIEQRMIDKYLQFRKYPHQYYQGILLYELLQASVKTVELGEYRLTGFLVKYVISNYSKELIQTVVKKLLDNQIYEDRKLKEISLSERLAVYFSINPQTAKYCMKKLLILLNTQYCYRNNLKYKGNLIFGENIFNDSGDAFTEEYCIQKVLKVGDDYGMLSIDILKPSWVEKCKKEVHSFFTSNQDDK